MATKFSGKYLDGLRVEAIHDESTAIIVSDAPLDNGGKGRGFSPTDMVAASLGMCAMTNMGLYAQNHGLDLKGATMKIVKTMSSEPPRRISKIEVVFSMPKGILEKDRLGLERTARACPVHQSLHAEVEQIFTFEW